MRDITLMDGGLGQELIKRSGDRATPLWSTQVMIDHPGLVQEVHRDFFDAGAMVATTNTYALHRDRLERFGKPAEFEHLLGLALAEAQAARDAHGSGRIAGSLGPLVASYRPDLAPSPEIAAPIYAEIAALIAPGVDFFILETMASVAQAEGALMGAQTAGKPIWLSLTVTDQDGRFLRSGEPLADAVRLIEAYAPQAVLANCSVPEVIGDALSVIKGFGVPFGAYANGFTQITAEFLKDSPTVDALRERDDMGPAVYADHAMRWIGQGATIVGGCCEVGPAHIAEISKRIREMPNG